MTRSPSKTPTLSNFAITRGLSPTSGYMYSQMPDGSLTPVKVKRTSLLGTQSQFGASEDKAIAGNIQEVEVAYLDRESDTLVVKFGLRAWRDPESANIETCNLAHVETTIQSMNQAYADAGGFNVLGERYAERIANAHPLWRNRYGFDRSVSVVIQQEGQPEMTLEFGKNPDPETLGTLGAAIAFGLSGKGVVDMQITMCSRIGQGQEVFPSQEMIIDSKISKISKVLNKDEHNQAMIHPWKLGNAIRTIDTWHPHVADVGAIAVEVYGTSVRRQEAYRYRGVGFYNYLAQVVAGEGDILNIRNAKTIRDLDNIKDAHYFMAVLVRGGVLGLGSGKKKTADETVTDQ